VSANVIYTGEYEIASGVRAMMLLGNAAVSRLRRK
jgi:hypothetical protein